jgi:hypothetical protein
MEEIAAAVQKAYASADARYAGFFGSDKLSRFGEVVLNPV